MKPLSKCRLYAFVDTAYLHGRSPEDIAEQLCEGGVDLIQLRAKHSPVAEIHQIANAILPITRSHGVGLVINDHPRVAQEVGAEFCHLGQEDFFDAGLTHVSQVVSQGDAVRVGLSSHTRKQAERAITAGAAYIAVGPVYGTSTKPGAAPVTLDYVRWAASNAKIPWFAIGGITLENLEDVMAAGARRICVVSAILNAANIVAACRGFKARLASVPLRDKP